MLRLKRFSYRFAEQVLNSKLALKQEIENILIDPSIDISSLSRPIFNSVLKENFVVRDGRVNHPSLMSPVTPQRRWIS